VNEVAARALRDVIHPRNDIVHPRDNPTGIETFVGLEHIEPQTGRRIGAVPIDLGSMTGRKARFLPGDIVYGYLRPYLNKVWIAEFAGFCSVDQYVFVVDEAVADLEYVASYLRSPAYLAAAPIDETPGQLPRIRIDEVLSTPIPLPPLDEQRRIAARLRELLAEVGRLRLAIDANRPSLESLERAALGVFEAIAWRNVAQPLGEIAQIIRGVTFGAADARSAWALGTLPVLRAGNISSTLKLSDGLVWVDSRLIATTQMLHLGDIAVCMSSGSASVVGKSAPLVEPFAGSVGAFCAIVRPGPRVDPAYLAGFMRSPAFWSWRGRSAQGVGIQNLKVTGLSELSVPLPPLDDQRRIAARLREQLAEIDRAKVALETQRAAIEALPAALLREVFGAQSAA
jgi:type I restriction enzyme S subunit